MSAFEEQTYTKEFDINLWKKILNFVKKYKKEMIILCFINLGIALGDVVFTLYTRYAIDTFIVASDFTYYQHFIAIYIVTIIVQSINIFSFILVAGKVETGLIYDIRKSGFKKLQELSLSYYDKTPVGWIMARMTSDAQKIGDVIAWAFVDLVWGVMILIIAAIIMFTIHAQLAAITFMIVPVLALSSFYFQKKILKGHREVRQLNSKITGAFNEGINGARTTKTLIREERNFKEFSELSSGMRNSSVRTAIISSIYQPVVIFICNIAAAAVLWRGGVNVMNGEISFGTLALFISYAIQIFDPIRQIAGSISNIISAQASAERTMQLLETEAEIYDTPKSLEYVGTSLDYVPDIEFKNVDFSYNTGEQILKDFNLKIKAGERVAFVGETGSGKSTIVNLICRFYEPTNGEIYIDGIDYRERPQLWLQSSLGYVLQTPHLFSGSIKENIRYAKLDATDDEIIQAAKTVNAYDFIVKLENGFDTEVGEGGSRLSTGEKQLISFARAILANPKIFILDEATSSVDTETEQMIQEAVDAVLSGRTSFIIAHRLSTIRSCDKIIVINKGKILESGSHKELLRQKGNYYKLYTNQFREEARQKLVQ